MFKYFKSEDQGFREFMSNNSDFVAILRDDRGGCVVANGEDANQTDVIQLIPEITNNE